MIHRNLNATFVVLEYTTLYLRYRFVNRKTVRLKFIYKIHHGNYLAKGSGLSDIFGFSGAKCNDGLHFGCPDDRASCIHNHITCTGMGQQRVIRGAIAS
jgi:hypothetical protein